MLQSCTKQRCRQGVHSPSRSAGTQNVCAASVGNTLCSASGFVCRVFLLYLVPTIYRFKYYFAWTVAEAGLTMAGMNYNGVNDNGVQQWDRYVNTRIRHVEFQTSLAKLPEHWNVCTGLFLRQCKYLQPTFVAMLHLMLTRTVNDAFPMCAVAR